jgi:hypothetical protein
MLTAHAAIFVPKIIIKKIAFFSDGYGNNDRG